MEEVRLCGADQVALDIAAAKWAAASEEMRSSPQLLHAHAHTQAARHGAALLQRTAQEAEVALDTLRARAAEVITARDQARESRRHQKQLENDIQCKESRKHYIELLLSADAALVALTAAVQERGEEDEDGELLPRHCEAYLTVRRQLETLKRCGGEKTEAEGEERTVVENGGLALNEMATEAEVIRKTLLQRVDKLLRYLCASLPQHHFDALCAGLRGKGEDDQRACDDGSDNSEGTESNEEIAMRYMVSRTVRAAIALDAQALQQPLLDRRRSMRGLKGVCAALQQYNTDECVLQPWSDLVLQTPHLRVSATAHRVIELLRQDASTAAHAPFTDRGAHCAAARQACLLFLDVSSACLRGGHVLASVRLSALYHNDLVALEEVLFVVHYILLGAPPDSVADEKDEEEIDVKRTAWCQCLVVGERLHQRADEVVQDVVRGEREALVLLLRDAEDVADTSHALQQVSHSHRHVGGVWREVLSQSHFNVYFGQVVEEASHLIAARMQRTQEGGGMKGKQDRGGGGEVQKEAVALFVGEAAEASNNVAVLRQLSPSYDRLCRFLSSEQEEKEDRVVGGGSGRSSGMGMVSELWERTSWFAGAGRR